MPNLIHLMYIIEPLIIRAILKLTVKISLSFALAWRQQDLSKEIGPADPASPPVLYLIPQPDGKIDFEDLMVLTSAMELVLYSS